MRLAVDLPLPSWMGTNQSRGTLISATAGGPLALGCTEMTMMELVR